MPRLTPVQKLLSNLEQKFPEHFGRLYMPKEKAYERLKQETGQDFGYDVEAWRKWFRENGRGDEVDWGKPE